MKKTPYVLAGLLAAFSNSIAAEEWTDIELVALKLKPQEVPQFLREAANELNKSMPMMVSAGVRVDTVLAGIGMSVMYSYTLLNVETRVTSEQWNAFTTEAKPRIINGACTANFSRVMIKYHKVAFKYEYHAADGSSLGRIIVTPQDCPVDANL